MICLRGICIITLLKSELFVTRKSYIILILKRITLFLFTLRMAQSI